MLMFSVWLVISLSSKTAKPRWLIADRGFAKGDRSALDVECAYLAKNQ